MREVHGVVLIAGLLASCSAQFSGAANEEAAVIAAVFDGMRTEADTTVPFVLAGRFVEVFPLSREGTPPSDSDVTDLVRRLGIDSIPADLSRELIRVAVEGDSLPWPIPARRRLVLDTLRTDGAFLDPPLWIEQQERARAAYGTTGIWSVSHVAFSPDRRVAAIYVQYFCGALCAGGSVHVLERTPTGWRTVREAMLWVS